LNVGNKITLQFIIDVFFNVSLSFEKLSSWSSKSYKGGKIGKSQCILILHGTNKFESKGACWHWVIGVWVSYQGDL
jgi:hypothetical protein